MQKLFRQYKSKYYPKSDSFLNDNENRAVFRTKNTQIIVNSIPVDILFVGDSITERWETGVYFRNFGTIINRGIGGECVFQLKNRLAEDVLELRPKLCICTEGVNDIEPLFQKFKAGQDITEDSKNLLASMKGEYRYIAETLLKEGIELWFGSVLPLGTSDIRNDIILELNNVIKEVCKEFGLQFINYHSAMADESGKRMKKFTFGDDLHPHVLGYNVMAEVLTPMLKERCIMNK